MVSLRADCEAQSPNIYVVILGEDIVQACMKIQD